MQKAFVFAVCCVLGASVLAAHAGQLKTQGANQMKVKINGVQIQGVRNVTGLNALENGVTAAESGSKRTGNLYTAGSPKNSEIVITRDATNDMTLFQWYKKASQGQKDRRNVSISLLNNQGEALRTVDLKNCWPARYTGPSMAQQKSAVAREKIELTCESFLLNGK